MIMVVIMFVFVLLCIYSMRVRLVELISSSVDSRWLMILNVLMSCICVLLVVLNVFIVCCVWLVLCCVCENSFMVVMFEYVLVMWFVISVCVLVCWLLIVLRCGMKYVYVVL